MKNASERGWYDRGYLPHLELSGRAIGITFRLADSLPKEVIEKFKQTLSEMSESDAAIKLARKISAYEDAGMGNCYLRIPECASLVVNALRHFDGERYRLLEWCVMPNHVHVLFSLIAGNGFEQVVRSWKNFTARQINKLLGKEGGFWEEDFFDRVIRDQKHLEHARQYIRMNPVKAGLCSTPEQWRWGSAWNG